MGDAVLTYDFAFWVGAPQSSLAGLWERGSEPVETFTILTKSATAALTDVHRRQPSILRAEDLEEWPTADLTRDQLLALAWRV